MSDRRMIRLLALSNAASWIVVGTLAVAAWVPAQGSVAELLRTERLEIVGQDGQPVMVLANKHELPGPIFEGKEFPPEMAPPRPHVAGMIFYNDAGDEVGGLVYNGVALDSGYTAVGHLSLDQWKQNQVVALQYLDNGRTLRSGLRVWDRPTNAPLREIFERGLAVRNASPAERDSLREVAEAAQQRVGGTERLFLGSQDGIAKLEIRDSEALVRVRLLVDESDRARLEFLNELGQVVEVYPPR